MVYKNFAQYNMTIKRKYTVLSIKDKITICEHLDKGSSKSKITSEDKITVFVYFMYIVRLSKLLIIWSQKGQIIEGANAIWNKLLELGDRYPGNNADLPIAYLCLQQKILKERKWNTLISRKEVVGWASEFCTDDPAVALIFHDIDTIIDPQLWPWSSMILVQSLILVSHY